MTLGLMPSLYIAAMLALAVWGWRHGGTARRVSLLFTIECGLANAAVWATGDVAPVLWFAVIYTGIGVAVLWPPANKTARLIGYGYIARLVAAWAAFIVGAYSESKDGAGRYLDIDASVAWLQLAALFIGTSYGNGLRLPRLHRRDRVAAPHGSQRDKA